jgi:hypothetical protein
MTGTLVLDLDGIDVKNGQTLSFPSRRSAPT